MPTTWIGQEAGCKPMSGAATSKLCIELPYWQPFVDVCQLDTQGQNYNERAESQNEGRGSDNDGR
jgi:hypothetical protein